MLFLASKPLQTFSQNTSPPVFFRPVLSTGNITWATCVVQNCPTAMLARVINPHNFNNIFCYSNDHFNVI